MKRQFIKNINTALIAPLAILMAGNVFAAVSCPSANAISNYKETTIADLSVSVNNATQIPDQPSINKYAISTPNENSIGGIPGLIAYCVYPTKNSNLPNSVASSHGNWDTKLTSGYFAYGRNNGNPTNIPFDGINSLDVGTATWNANIVPGNFPDTQLILLHINDPVECNTLYGGNPGTCFVYPKGYTCTVDCGDVPGDGTLSGMKYYDANANGVWDSVEVGIANWPITIHGAELGINTLLTDTSGNFSYVALPGATYTVYETQANGPWMQTGNTSLTAIDKGGNVTNLDNFKYMVSVSNDGGTTEHLDFGNVCIGSGGGLTLGFWSNKNGQALFLSDDLALMVTLHLKNAIGDDFDPNNYTAFRTWLLGANATNMAYMLSAQLAAMELNVFNGKVSSSALIYAPGAKSASPTGFAKVSELMTEANAELSIHGLTNVAGVDRTYQETLKTALDNANNNMTFLKPDPNSCPTPVFPQVNILQ
jgi:hypothetical protein